jgi:hypothetical protein
VTRHGWTQETDGSPADRYARALQSGGVRRQHPRLADFAVRYADQNEQDYQAFTAAIDSGRLPVQRGL